MTDKELHRLNRAQLLEILLEQSRRIDQLKEQVEALQKQVDSRRVVLEQSGSIAEASLALTKTFQQAQEAADLYLENVKRICREKAVASQAEEGWEEFLRECAVTPTKEGT